MTTIPDTMKNISRDIQNVFGELMKLLIRKSLRPVLNPLKSNTKVIYNNYRGKYERGFIGSVPDDNVNKYSYVMTQESLGWTEEILVNFKVIAKFIKNSVQKPIITPTAKNHNLVKSKSRVAFSDREGKQRIVNGKVPSMTQYKNFISILSSRNLQNIIVNKQASFMHTTDVPYTFAFKELESVGRDIIEQTDPSICAEDTAKMSTSMLRVKLFILEETLMNLSVCDPNIFDAYIEMLRIINCVPRAKMVWVINLIAAMTYQRWPDLPENQKQLYLDILGSDFISAFNENELITILLQADQSELILTTSYLFPLLKMLFIVFGYSKLVPLVTDSCNESMIDTYRDRMKKHLDKYRGASYRRGDNREIVLCEETEPMITNPFNPNYPMNQQPLNGPPNDPLNEQTWSEHYMDDLGNPTRIVNRNFVIDNAPDNPYDEPVDIYQVDPEPIDQCIYDYIKLFGDLYPTLIGLMGGTESFPPETIEISCSDIPPTYDYLGTVPEFFMEV